jgi:hypothetical protein
MSRTASNFDIGWSNCSRSVAYECAASKAPCASPTERAAIEIRPPSSVFLVCSHPSPASPSKRSAGIRQSSNWSSQVGEAFSPIFFQTFVTSNPSSSGETTNVEMPS